MERLEQPDEARLQLRRGIAVEPVAVEARHQHLRFVAGNDDVRLERLEAPLDDLAAERCDVVVRRQFRRGRHLPGTCARRAAMRPVGVDIVRADARTRECLRGRLQQQVVSALVEVFGEAGAAHRNDRDAVADAM